MKKIKYVFVVLVYKNSCDLLEFLKSVKEKFINISYQIVVVNSYFDDITKKDIENICIMYKCDFINIENKGYGYGNNIGVEFVRSTYNYDFIIISNPDILIENFVDLKSTSIAKIIAPKILNKKNQNQNPHIVKRHKFIEFIKYIGFKYNFKYIVYIGIALNKLEKSLWNSKTIYACHGAFLILNKRAIECLDKIYNEDMFLFGEEDHLGTLCEEKNILIELDHEFLVFHKEDGSVGEISMKVWEITKKSYITYYNFWNKKGERI